MKHVLVLSFFCINAYLFSSVNIEGSYTTKTQDVPGSSEEVSGALTVIKSSDQVYQFTWDCIENGKHALYSGTGIRDGSNLSVCFQEMEANQPKSGGIEGVQIYKIEKDLLRGPFVYLGGTQIGIEEAMRKQGK